jgi:hypothetical protein
MGVGSKARKDNKPPNHPKQPSQRPKNPAKPCSKQLSFVKRAFAFIGKVFSIVIV